MCVQLCRIAVMEGQTDIVRRALDLVVELVVNLGLFHLNIQQILL